MAAENNLTKALKKSIKDSLGVDEISFSDEDGGNKVTYDLNTEAEKVAVDEGVQAALPKDARWHRREARRLLIGKSGMSDEKKVMRMKRAIAELEAAVKMMETGEVE